MMIVYSVSGRLVAVVTKFGRHWQSKRWRCWHSHCFSR